MAPTGVVGARRTLICETRDDGHPRDRGDAHSVSPRSHRRGRPLSNTRTPSRERDKVDDDRDEAQRRITDGRTALGIELGSTRIKAVLIGDDHEPLAVGSHSWENQFVDRRWTYSLESVWAGVAECYAALAADVRQRYDVQLTSVGALGVSAMMHGYLAFDADGELLTPFRTWRNTNTSAAVEQLSARLEHNIPHRWSVAHLYQAILDNEDHVGNIAHLTTLAGYVHW